MSRAGVDALLRRGYTHPDAPPAPVVSAPRQLESRPGRPDPADKKAEWVEYARASGVHDPDAMTKAELVELLG